MYKLKKIEDIYLLPKSVQRCIVKRQTILDFVYKNKNNSLYSLIVENLHDILIKHTLESYENENISSYIVLEKNELDKIRTIKLPT